MNRIRYAGLLIRAEDDNATKKYWCVVRNGNFVIFPNYNSNETYRRSDDVSPAFILPISHLSATAYVLPSSTKRFPTQYSLVLECAKSGQQFTFYADNSVTLEKWVDSIKAEATSDEISSQDIPPGALLPPEVSYDFSTSILSPDISHQIASRFVFGKQDNDCKKTDGMHQTLVSSQHRSIPDNNEEIEREIDRLYKKRKISSNVSYYTSSPFNTTPPFHDFYISESSTPVSTSPSSCHQSYQGSADESSLSSSTTSSPMLAQQPRRKTRSSLTRKLGSYSENSLTLPSRSSKKASVQQEDHPSLRKLREEQEASLKTREEKKNLRPYFYTGEGETKLETTRGNGKSNNTSTKRHTITGLSVLENAAVKKTNKSAILTQRSFESTAAAPTRRSIAPISSLDRRLLRRRRPLSQSLHAHDVNRPKLKVDLAPYSKDDSSTKEKIISTSASNTPPKVSASLDLQEAGKTPRTPVDRNNLSFNYDVKSFGGASDLEVAEKVKLRSKSPKNKHLLSSASFGGSLKRSEKIGSRVLQRVGSAVVKRSKDADKKKSTGKTAGEMGNTQKFSSQPSIDPELRNATTVMEGWLYKQKLMSKQKYWVTLSSAKLLTFFKNEQEALKCEAILDVINLQNGCEVENVVQAKNSNSFNLIPQKSSTTDGLLGSSQHLNNSSSPKTPGKPLQLLCKNTQEFVHWMKAFVLLNASQSSKLSPEIYHPVRILNPIKPSGEEGSRSKVVDMITSNHESAELNNNFQKHSTGNNSGINKHQLPTTESAKGVENFAQRNETAKSLEEPEAKSFEAYRYSISYIDEDVSEDNESPERKDISSMTKEESQQKSHFLDNERQTGKSHLLESTDSNVTFVPLQTPEKDVDVYTGKSSSKLIALNNQKSKDQISGLRTVSSSKEWIQTSQVIAPRLRRSPANQEVDLKGGTTATSLSNTKPSNLTKYELRNYGAKPEIDVKGSKKDARKSNLGPACGLSDTNDLQNAGRSSRHWIPDKKKENRISPSPFSFALEGQNTDAMSFTQSHSRSDSGVVGDQFSFSERPLSIVKQPSCVADKVKLFEGLHGYSSKDLNHHQAFHSRSQSVDEVLIAADSRNENSTDYTAYDLGASLSAAQLKYFLETRKKIAFAASSGKKEALLSNLNSGSLRRSFSDSNILDSSGEEINASMKTPRKSVPVLTRIDFIEQYANPLTSNISPGYTARVFNELCLPLHSLELRKRRSSVESNNSVQTKDLSDGALSDSSLKGLTLSAAGRTPSTSSGSSDNSRKVGEKTEWLTSFTPRLRKSLHGSSGSIKRRSKAQELQIPPYKLADAAHYGYLEKKHKKREWEKFWCVFQDSCLYCYNSPQSEVTRDAILLRGYDVIADVMNVNRTRYEFRLERQGARSLYFSTDNYEEFLLWVGTIEKETRKVPMQKREEKNESQLISDQSPASGRLNGPTSTPSSQMSSDASTNASPRSLSRERLEKDLVEVQRQLLLKEIVAQQKKLVQEQRILVEAIGDSKANYTASEAANDMRRHKLKRDDVLKKFNKEREQEEMKATKYMALLNCRRNSAQLKVDQLAKEIAPKSGKRRSQDHKQFGALEAKLAEMKQRLAKIDNEISDLQANKQNALDKIRERQDLELLVTEQQESLSILLRHGNDSAPSSAQRHRRQSSNSRSPLESIEEDENVSKTSTTASSESLDADGSSWKEKLAPFYRQSRTPPVFDDAGKSPELQDPKNPGATSADSYGDWNHTQSLHNLSDGIKTSFITSSASSLVEVSATSTNNSQPSLSRTSKPPKSQDKNRQEIDPSVLAGIEEFEKFSLNMLQKTKKPKK